MNAHHRPLLATQNLSKSFGSLAAVQNVSMEVTEGEIHAVIGPNGAGKTTFLNLLTGELAPNGGKIVFGDSDITSWPPNLRAKAGIGRSFQHSSIFEDLTVHENLRLAAQTQFPRSFGYFYPADQYADVAACVSEILTGLSFVAASGTRAGELSHGEQRQLEIGMLMAVAPKLMILDEPTSGMSRNETLDLMTRLERLSAGYTMILVEHDMDVVFQLADRVTVLVNGSVLATGSPEEVRLNAAVRRAYLGDDN